MKPGGGLWSELDVIFRLGQGGSPGLRWGL